MNNHSLLPKESLEHLSDYQAIKKSEASTIIYFTVILFVISIIALLPFISIDISVASPGLLRPSVEISTIKIPTTGKITKVFVTLNQHVHKGQPIVALDSALLQQKISFMADEIKEDSLLANDLQQLISEKHNHALMSTPYYRQSLTSYSQKKQDLAIRYNKAKLNFDRNYKLHQQKVIADAEFENFQFELTKAKNDLELLKQNQLSEWQSELSSYKKEIAGYEAQLEQYLKEKSNLIIKAPISGTIENLASIHEESLVFANQDIAQISPDTSLIVELYVKPNDIGLLKTSMPVRFQIDAFNYNQWGLATGKIVEISNDVSVINENPVFKVRCSLDRDYLQLKNTYKGYLKKGMTLQARFMVTERTLWQLIYDKTDDWLNPNVSQISSAK